MSIVKVNVTKLSENVYVREADGFEYTWDASTIIQFCKEKKYKTFEIPVSSINLSMKIWDIDSFYQFIHHAKRVSDVDMSNPIILDEKGVICDGWHRVAKAILNNDESIKAIRMNDMPTYSSKTKINE